MTSEQVAEIAVEGDAPQKIGDCARFGIILCTLLLQVLLPAGILGRFTRWFNKKRGIAKGEGAR